MRILFYNNASIGDLFMQQQIIRQVIKCNPDENIQFYGRSNHFILNDVSDNLLISLPRDFKTVLECYPFSLIHKFDENTFMFNTWIWPLGDECLPRIRIECDPYLIQEAFCIGLEKYMGRLNNIRINYTKLSRYELLPSIPPTNIDKFREWRNSIKDRKILFYYNFIPRSLNYPDFPLENYNMEKQHIEIIEHISRLNPTLLIVVPAMTPHTNTNLILCSRFFDTTEIASSENLYKIGAAAALCDYSVHYETGGCFTFFNRDFSLSNTKILHIAVTPFFINTFKNYLEQSNINTDRYSGVFCKTINEIKEYFSNHLFT